MEKKTEKTKRKATSPWAAVRHSSIHGRGMFATCVIPKGTQIIEYVGEKISKAEALKREEERQRRAERGGDGCIYIFEINSRRDIDGRVRWNTARYINHSCEPNCESQLDRGRIWIIALREIQAGEELSYDYYFDYEHHKDHPCRCASKNCVGYIVKKPQRWRLRSKTSLADEQGRTATGV